jgi:hypothetical protein
VTSQGQPGARRMEGPAAPPGFRGLGRFDALYPLTHQPVGGLGDRAHPNAPPQPAGGDEAKNVPTGVGPARDDLLASAINGNAPARLAVPAGSRMHVRQRLTGTTLLDCR